jgi:hypothetical protein
MKKDNIAGPVFISIGDSDKINVFLEKNPRVPRELLFVDDYKMEAYKAAGFELIGDGASKLFSENRKIKAPKFGFGRWKDYLTSAMKLAPIEKGSNKLPDTVLMNGGTFAVNRDKIIYTYSDVAPGDYPEPIDVLKSFE